MDCFREDGSCRKLELAIVAVCRQLYEEGIHVLWATNTFSFADSWSLRVFLEALDTAQKSKLRKLHFATNMADYDEGPADITESAKWERVIKS